MLCLISAIQQSDSIIHIYVYILVKEMATHSGILVWRIPWAEEPVRLQSMGSQESDMT